MLSSLRVRSIVATMVREVVSPIGLVMTSTEVLVVLGALVDNLWDRLDASRASGIQIGFERLKVLKGWKVL